MHDLSPEFFDKLAASLDVECDLEEVYNKVFPKPDYAKALKPYLIALLNSPVPSRRYNAVAFLDSEEYNKDKEVWMKLHQTLQVETNTTVRSMLESTLVNFYKMNPNLKGSNK